MNKKIKHFGLSSWAIDNRKTAFVIIAIILIGGLMSYLGLPRESFPEIVESKIYVSSIYPGNSAQDVEKLITKPLEEEIDDITGVTKITSTSVQDYSSIQVEFTEDITPEEAKIKVKDKIDAVKALQDWPTLDGGAKVEPNAFDLDISEITPIANINLTGDFTSEQLKDFGELLQDEMEELPEIKEVQILGVEDKEIEVAVDVFKLNASDLSMGDVINAIRSENVTISGGNVIQNGMQRNIRVVGEIDRPGDLQNVVVKNDGGRILLRDIAKINFREKDRTTYAREYSKPVVMLSILKKSGKNMISAINKVKDIIDEAKEEYLPENLNISITNDQSTRTEAQVSELENSIIFGVLLVVSVLMFFLGFRNAIFVGIAIPLSIMMSFLILPGFGSLLGMNITLNTMVLFATVMGLGMLVDNGIVVVENVYRLMDEGVPRIEAAKQGVGEIAMPIIASTGTTLAAFLPLGFWPGIMGKFMIYFPLTLATVLGSSLFIALVVNSMLTSVFMKTEEVKMEKKQLIKISLAIGAFGIFLLLNGLFPIFTTIPQIELLVLLLPFIIGGSLIIYGLVLFILGWLNRGKTKRIREGLALSSLGFLIFLISAFGSPKVLIGFGFLFLVLAILLWVHTYWLLPLSDKFQFSWLPALEKQYKNFLGFALRGKNPYFFFFGTLSLLVLAFIIFAVATPKTLFFPVNEPNMAIVYIEYPEGTDIEKTDDITSAIEKKVISSLDKYSYLKDGKAYNYMAESIISQVGEGAGNPQTDGGSQNEMPHKGKVTVLFREFKYRVDENNNKHSSSDVLSELRDNLKGYPGVSVIVEKDQAGPPSGYAINIEVRGDDYNTLLVEAESIRQFVVDKNIPGIEELLLDVNQNKPEMEVFVDREKAGQLGVTTAMVGNALRQAIYGFDTSTYKEGEDDYDIYVRFNNENRYNESALFNQSVTFRDNQGKLKKVPISAVVEKRNIATFSSIKRKNLKRVITVYSNVLEGYNPTEIVGKIDNLLDGYNLSKGITYQFTGEQEEQNKNLAFLTRALLIAMALILLIIVAQFNSISKPLIILVAIVLSFIGVLFGMVLFGNDFVILMTMMGIIALAGIVVNNAIVLIDYTQLLIDRKKLEMGLAEDELLTRLLYRQAIIDGGKARLRPVLLTAITTVLGLLPLAIGFNIDFFSLFTEFDPKIYFGGDNTIFWKPMTLTIIYGLIFATFLTLIIVPVMFYLLNRAKIRMRSAGSGKPL